VTLKNGTPDLIQYIILHIQNLPINFRIPLNAKCISKPPEIFLDKHGLKRYQLNTRRPANGTLGNLSVIDRNQHMVMEDNKD
jgi:hypothetical protein